MSGKSNRPIVIVGDVGEELAETLAEAGYEISRVPSPGAVTGDSVVIAESATLAELGEKKKLLAALVVHDLRNPLTALQGNIGLLGEIFKSEDPMVAQVLGDLEEITERALTLVAGLLDVEELEEGMLTARPSEVDVGELLSRTSRHQRATMSFRELTLETDVPEGLTSHLDPHLIGRLVENLVDNGCRYAPRGGRVKVEAYVERDQLVIGVANSGPPIPERSRDLIFERFFCVEDRRASARSNRGLGLYFCKLAAEAHGGTIAVAGGTEALPARFEIRLPR